MPARSIAEFTAEARAKLAKGLTPATLEEVGAALAAAAFVPGFVPEASFSQMHQSDSSASVLHSDRDGLTLVLGLFSVTETPVHDHGAWGVACIIRGSDRYRHYDPPKGEGEAPRLRYERVLKPGDFVNWLDPPDDIHSQQGIGEAALEIVLFGRNVMEMPRRYYDLASGRVTTAMPQ